jgi:ring-1,2-phenylacetyl-CoA epoxidase subunit PaaE
MILCEKERKSVSSRIAIDLSLKMINFAFLLFHSMIPKFHTLAISDLRRETQDTVSIAFAVPANLRSEFQYQSGQYLTLRTLVEGEDLRRSYSLSSSPFEKEWRVAVKQVEGGKFSSFANAKLEVGQTLQVMTPAGNFQVNTAQDHQKTYVLFAAGSGITPIISIAKTILQEEPKSDVTLFYGNKGFASIIFREELEALKNRFMDRLRVVHILSRESLGNAIQKGRIDAQKIKKLYSAFLKDSVIDEVFVCGPEDMIHSVRETFSSLVGDSVKVHFELFTTANLGKEAEKVVSDAPAIAANVKVIIDGDTLELNLDSNGDSILDAASKAGGDLPFACKGGVCCTCKARILEGTASMDRNYALEADEIAAGYILTCQAHPTSKTLTVSFDD